MILDKIYKHNAKIKYWDKICRHIAPPAITEHKNHIMIGEDITKVILVGRPLEKVAGWPNGLNASFMDQLLDIGCNEHVTVSISSLYIPIPPDKSVELYNQSVLKLSTNKRKSENSNEQSGLLILDARTCMMKRGTSSEAIKDSFTPLLSLPSMQLMKQK